MGMASSQVRLLAITNRMHDIEYKAQNLQNAKLRLSQDQDEAYKKYNDILDATTLTTKDREGNVIRGTFDNLMANGLEIGGANFAFVDEAKRCLVVPDDVYSVFADNPNRTPEEMALELLTGDKEYDIKQDFWGTNGKFVDILINQTTEFSSIYSGDSTNPGVLDSIIKFLETHGSEETNFTNNESQQLIKAFLAGIKDNTNRQDVLQFILCVPSDDTNVSDQLTSTGVLEHDGTVPCLSSLSDIEFTDKDTQKNWEELIDKLTSEVVTKHVNDQCGDNKAEHDKYDRYLLMFRMAKSFAGNDKDKLCRISNYNDEACNMNASGDSNWLKEQLESGRFTINEFKSDCKARYGGTLSGTSVATNPKVDYTAETTVDKAKLAKAEAEYEHTLKQIDRKEAQYDRELSKLESERKALDTEREGIKKVMEDNVDRTFGLFS